MENIYIHGKPMDVFSEQDIICLEAQFRGVRLHLFTKEIDFWHFMHTPPRIPPHVLASTTSTSQNGPQDLMKHLS